MKKVLIVFAIVQSVIFAPAFGRIIARTSSNPRALKTFESEFKNVSNVNWEERADLSRASFTWENFHLVAYFNNEGELLMTERTILFNQLPLVAMNSISNRFENSAFYEVVEFTGNGETFYMVTVEQGSKKIRVRATPWGNIVVEKKIRP